MFRKFFAAVVAVMLAVGGIFADDIKGVFKKIDGDKLTVEVDGKEKTYTVDKDAKTKVKKQEVALSEALGKWKEGQKATFTIKDDKVTAAKKEKKQ